MSPKYSFSPRHFAMVAAALVLIAGAALSGRQSAADTVLSNDRYYIRVTGCDDGGRAYINMTQVVDVGFGEDSRWLDVTDDLIKETNQIKFEVVNKTGAITYDFQVRRNDTVIYSEACGTAGMYGCENNRAFRLGVAREFTYQIDKAAE